MRALFGPATASLLLALGALGLLALAAPLGGCGSDGGGGDDIGEVPDGVEPGAPAVVAAPDAWHPAPGTSWQWQLTGAIDMSYDVDMYDVDLFETTDDEMAALRRADRTIICYFSAGSREEYRDDAGDFPAAVVGEVLDNWPHERWLDVRAESVRAVMRARLDYAAARGCDGVEPDNVDGYQNATGFPLTVADQLDFDRFLANEAHARGLSVGLKNAVDLVPALEPYFDWALNEECFAYDECDTLAPFIDAGKAVFHVEYVDKEADADAELTKVCGAASTTGFSTLVALYDLAGWSVACP
ncbi:MAG: endo alpha-1,4 polygalactosaminidase [Myxococcales bacterium]|nr:endo alpha-1,4 polygalactosaminidase [Myxococcales bacterium]MCB9732551.1 endo alpha-1,4 polygalactosaminidase [Deltaproteobacteria bacterium]